MKISLLNLSLLISLLLPLGCRSLNETTEDQGPTDNRFISPISPPRNLGQAERIRFRRLCDAGEAARFRYESTFDGELVYRIERRERACGESQFVDLNTAEGSFRRQLNGMPGIQTDTRAPILSDLFTDEHPLVRAACTRLFNAQELPNILSLESERVQFELGQISNYDAIVITQFRPDSSGVYFARSVETFAIKTSLRTGDFDQLGEVVERSQTLPCASNRSFIRTRHQRHTTL